MGCWVRRDFGGEDDVLTNWGPVGWWLRQAWGGWRLV